MSIEKHIHYFTSEADYNRDRFENYLEPWVSLTEYDDVVRINHNKDESEVSVSTPLTFKITSSGVLYWKSTDSSNSKAIEYQKNDGDWTAITAATGTGYAISVDSGDILQFRGSNNSYLGTNMFDCSSGTKFELEGNINSLLSKTSYATNTALPNAAYTFRKLFKSCDGLTHANKLVLPSKITYTGCYQEMFSGCTSLVDSPSIFAENGSSDCCKEMFRQCTSLVTPPEYVLKKSAANSSCNYMFGNCTSLESAPDLPATALTAGSCYSYMFVDCINLKTAHDLPALSIPGSAYAAMFKNCTSLKKAPEISATTVPSYCMDSMFLGCSGLTTPPSILPAPSLGLSCYMQMFKGCKSLLSTPELPATVMHENSYRDMFESCYSLVEVSELPAETLNSACYMNMFANCKSLVNSPTVLPAETLVGNCYNGMFAYCDNLETAPEIEATAVTAYSCQYMFKGCKSLIHGPSKLLSLNAPQNCYYEMFNGCKSMVSGPEICATTISQGCCMYMFQDCSALTGVTTILPAETLAGDCYNSMFQRCTSLRRAPELPAKTLVNGCYRAMFNGCNSLNYIKCLATNISATYPTYNWVGSVASSGTFVKDSSMTGWGTGVDGIPSNWTVENYVSTA